MAITFVGGICAGLGVNGAAYPTGTTGVDLTGADLLVVGVAEYQSATSTSLLDDSNGYHFNNTFIPLTAYHDATICRVTWSYVLGPNVTSGTVSPYELAITSNGSFITYCVMGFAGVKASGAFDQETGNSATSGTSISTGSVTPSEDNCLVITALCVNDNVDTASISSYTQPSGSPIQGSGGNWLGGAFAYHIQTTATATNPTWTWGTSGQNAATVAVFKSAAGGGGGGGGATGWQNIPLMGVG